MSKTIMALIFATISFQSFAQSNIVTELDEAHASNNWGKVIGTVRSEKANSSVQSWFKQQVLSGHPMYVIEEANNELQKGNVKNAMRLNVMANLAMSGDVAICMEVNAKKAALQHFFSYKDLMITFNREMQTVDKVIRDILKDDKMKKPDLIFKYDDNWVCNLVNPPGMTISGDEKKKMKLMAQTTFLITTKNALEVGQAMVGK